MFFSNKNVLVTGSMGLVGSHLVEALVREGAHVRAVWHKNQPSEEAAHGVVQYTQADLMNNEDCKRVVENIDYAFLCSASTSGAAVMTKSPLSLMAPNVIMNSQILEASYHAGIKKVVWLSSTTGYPETGDRPTHENDMFVGDPHDKYFPVGWMKRYTEVLCRMYNEKVNPPMTCVVLRPTNVFGPRDKFDPLRSHVLPALIRKAVERMNPFEVWGDGTDVRDFIYVSDMVSAMMMAMEKVESYLPMNIGMGKSYTVTELLNMILEIENFKDAQVVYNASKPTMIPKRTVDVSRAYNVLGWRAHVDLAEGLRKTIIWYKNHVDSINVSN